MAGRVAFVDKHYEEIIDSATRPLDGRGWWRTAEDPFQVCWRGVCECSFVLLALSFLPLQPFAFEVF